MSLLLRNRRRDERIDILREVLDELLIEGECGRAEVRDRLVDLNDIQSKIREADE